jgi:predicted  nucleic acid-binding Zn-ribbon protein
MRGGTFWISGLILLLFAFSALRFHSVVSVQKESHERLLKVEETLQGGGLPRVSARTDVSADTKTIESLSLQLANFMRELHSQQKGFDRKLSDLDDRVNHERETILRDLETFMEDLRNERRELSGQLDRVQSGPGAEVTPPLAEIAKKLGAMEQAIRDLAATVHEEATRRDEVYERESTGVTVEGMTTGPGSDRRTRY